MPVAQTEVIINAPISKVWEVMMDVDRYCEWNPFIIKIDCEAALPQVGTDLMLHVRFSGSETVRVEHERITRLDAPATRSGSETALLEYQFLGPLHAFYLVRGKRQQSLESLDGSRTRYRSYERLHGLLAWLAPMAKVQDGFERHAAALRQRCED